MKTQQKLKLNSKFPKFEKIFINLITNATMLALFIYFALIHIGLQNKWYPRLKGQFFHDTASKLYHLCCTITWQIAGIIILVSCIVLLAGVSYLFSLLISSLYPELKQKAFYIDTLSYSPFMLLIIYPLQFSLRIPNLGRTLLLIVLLLVVIVKLILIYHSIKKKG